MLVIRMQRTGRKGHAMFRVVVQDSRRTPTSGKVVARLGSYDPHTKTVTLDKEKAAFYLEHGAQPSDRAVTILKSEGIKLPKWVKESSKQERATRNPDKRRSTRPEEPVEEAPAEAEAPAEDAPAETTEVAEAPAENTEAATEEAPAEEATEAPAESEAPAEEAKTEESSEEA